MAGIRRRISSASIMAPYQSFSPVLRQLAAVIVDMLVDVALWRVDVDHVLHAPFAAAPCEVPGICASMRNRLWRCAAPPELPVRIVGLPVVALPCVASCYYALCPLVLPLTCTGAREAGRAQCGRATCRLRIGSIA